MKSKTVVIASLILFSACGSVAWADGPADAKTKDDIPQLINLGELKWVKTIPSAGDKSPEYAILHVDTHTHLTTLMFRTPVPVHIKAHTHALAETHVVLSGGTHVFEANGVRYDLEKGATSECQAAWSMRLGYLQDLRR